MDRSFTHTVDKLARDGRVILRSDCRVPAHIGAALVALVGLGRQTRLRGGADTGRVPNRSRSPVKGKAGRSARRAAEAVTRLVLDGGVIALTGKPGGMLMFHGNLVHGSPPNITPHPRKIIYLTLNAVSNHIREPTRPEWIPHRYYENCGRPDPPRPIRGSGRLCHPDRCGLAACLPSPHRQGRSPRCARDRWREVDDEVDRTTGLAPWARATAGAAPP